MVRILTGLALAPWMAVALAQTNDPTDDLNKKPVTTDTGEIGKLLKKWHAEGAAARNGGGIHEVECQAISTASTASYHATTRSTTAPSKASVSSTQFACVWWTSFGPSPFTTGSASQDKNAYSSRTVMKNRLTG